MKFLIVLFSICFFLLSCSIIGPGQRGVRIMLGTTSDKFKEPGPYLWFPFILAMAKVDVQIQKSEATAESASKDSHKARRTPRTAQA